MRVLALALVPFIFLGAVANDVNPTAADQLKRHIAGTSVNEWRGYYKREHSLVKPYQGSGMDVPYWDIIGSTMVTAQQIRLTRNDQGMKGAIWNKVPVWSRDWELQVGFKVHGTTGDLFGDGIAIWYAQDPNQLGDVFGSKDYFRGLAVFLDTYSNHNGPHSHGHPFISAMVANGSSHYDHDRDGTHTQLGGEGTGCEAKFRNKDHETQILIQYVGNTLAIFTDITGEGTWKECLSVDGVHLPTGYYIGMSAATGDLSDNHDITSVKMFEQEFARVELQGDVDSKSIEPHAEYIASPRDHVDDPKPSKLGWMATTFLVIAGIAVIVVVVFFGFTWMQKRQERSRKRFY
uniref:L-type lectin-like domain-containing protein n=2 Tax=Steinernema glaseri TaxID=37863 RepID=A0A1I7YI54_9BILA